LYIHAYTVSDLEGRKLIRASIVGATGYTGAVLTDILAEHPDVRLDGLTSQTYVGRSVSEVFPDLRVEGRYEQYAVSSMAGSDVVFVCYPHGQAHLTVAELIDAGCRVVDLSADFRLKDARAYREWYDFAHPRPDLVAEAVFGLPEVYRSLLGEARLVANPGCYPTGMLLGLLPVAGDIDPGGVMVDSKSGVTGAGRPPSEKTHFCAVNENFRAYNEVGHRHTPEMVQELGAAAGRFLPVSFTPHLLPVDRGIQTTMYFRPQDGLAGTDSWLQRYLDFYEGEPFVEVCEHIPSLAEVARTNACRITVREDAAAGVVKVFTVIDNLVKGASGQAVQNMNCMFGLAEEAGLRRRV
jgi:N-acetyl-gamma-glutamyl-phosphate reductase